MTTEKLGEILENHSKWLNDDGGSRADLRGADLRDANLFRCERVRLIEAVKP